MANNMTPLTGLPLEQPSPSPKRIYALFDREGPCVNHHAPFRGAIPCTGVLQCTVCASQWEPDTGNLIRAGNGRPDLYS